MRIGRKVELHGRCMELCSLVRVSGFVDGFESVGHLHQLMTIGRSRIH